MPAARSRFIETPAITWLVTGGALAALCVAWLAQYAGSQIAPAEFDVDTGEILIPLGSTIALIIGWFVGTFGGAWLAMRISNGDGP